MKNLKQLIGIITLVVVIIFSIVAIACNDLSGGSANFLGNWRGKVDFNYYYSSREPDQSSATISFTTTGWIFRSQDGYVSESGIYDLSGNTATLWFDDYYNIFGTAALIKTNKLFLTITDREYRGSNGEFTRY